MLERLASSTVPDIIMLDPSCPGVETVRSARAPRTRTRTKQLALAAEVGLAITEATLEEVAERVVERVSTRVGALGVALAVARGGTFEVVSSFRRAAIHAR